jgi:D-ribose pyranose/furanose isomerase RbsD
MKVRRWLVVCGMTAALSGCAAFSPGTDWRGEANNQLGKLGYRNWIVISEASLPAQNRPGIHQITATAEIPEVVDYVLRTMEQTENVRPRVYVTREMRAVENNFAPGMDTYREALKKSLHAHETTELDQQALLTLMEDANRTLDVLVIRTQTALPYSSIFMELQPGYWDGESEARLRERIQRQRMQKLAQPIP